MIVIQKKYKDVVIGDKKKDWSEDEDEGSENEAVAGWYGEDIGGTCDDFTSNEFNSNKSVKSKEIDTELAERIVDHLAEDCSAQAGISSKPNKKQKSNENSDEDETM